MAMKKEQLLLIKLIFWGIIGFQLSFVTPCYALYKKTINTPYYQQQTDYWCGPASAQMILESENVKPRLHPDYPISDTTYNKQNTLWTYIQNHNNPTTPTNWATDPQGLEATLDHYDSGGNYLIAKYTDAREASKRLIWSIYNYNVPAAALLYKGRHWVTVRGFQTDVEPNSNSYEFKGFWVNDPWYDSNSLGVNRYIGWSQWKNTYFTPLHTGNGDPWNGYRVCVWEPPEPAGTLIIPEVAAGPDTVTTPEEAIDSAQVAVMAHNLSMNSQPRNAVWVRWGTTDCWSVPWVDENDNVTGVVTIDWRGNLLEASWASEPTPLSSFLAQQTYPFVTPLPSARELLPGEQGITQPYIVPEPTTLLLLGGGMGFLATRLRRKKK
jgi:hypothetical protein